jgi:hypothetical protein
MHTPALRSGCKHACLWVSRKPKLRAVTVCHAQRSSGLHPKRKRPVKYLELSEEWQIRYGLPKYPSCTPEQDFTSQSDMREEIHSMIRLLPDHMRDFLLTHDLKFDVRLACVATHCGLMYCRANELEAMAL